MLYRQNLGAVRVQEPDASPLELFYRLPDKESLPGERLITRQMSRRNFSLVVCVATEGECDSPYPRQLWMDLGHLASRIII